MLKIMSRLAVAVLAIAALFVAGCSNGDELEQLKARVGTLEEQRSALEEMAETLRNLTKDNGVIDKINARLDAMGYDDFKAETRKNLETLNQAAEALGLLTAGLPGNKSIKEFVEGAVKEVDDKVGALSLSFETWKTTELVELLKKADKYTDQEVGKVTGKYNELKTTVDSNLDAITILNGDATIPGSVKNQIEAAKGDLINYVDEKYNELIGYITDLYSLVSAGLERIQSVVFVPQYDDLKMDINVTKVSQTIINSDGEEEKVIYFMPQPTEVTFKVTPAEYVEWLAYYVDAYNLNKQRANEYMEYFGYSYPAVFFDVKKLKTRAEDEDESMPRIDILCVNSYDKTTGEITFLVEPTNIVSAEFACNAIKPAYSFSITDSTDHLITVNNSDGDKGDVTGFNLLGALEYLYGMNPFIIPVWPFEDYLDFSFRDAYAASLTIYVPDADNWYRYMDMGSDLEMSDYRIYGNEVASAYSLLYPVVTECEIDKKPYKRITDENGDPAVREFTEEEIHQTLPYNALRSNGDYRVILQDAVPAVLVDDEPYGLFPENSSGGFVYVYTKYGDIIQVPGYKLVFEGFTYDQNTSGYALNKNNFIETEKVYAEIEMNPEVSVSNRQRAKGNLITGTYSVNFDSGSFAVSGDVLITNP